MTARLRFAPSPTGMMHLGNARTALFNWLYARHVGGAILLRIEDTDESRGHPDWIDLIYRSLEWLGLDWDGPPTFQSARFETHRAAAKEFHARGLAYYCDCSHEAVEQRWRAAGSKPGGYDSFCSDRGLAPGKGRLLRFRVPTHEPVVRADAVRGTVEIDPATIGDFSILRGNGVPLYVFANALDDIEDGITHILRGEDHLSNVAKQILIRRSLGAEEPVWAHLPMILNAQRKKLSKRRDKAALASYQEDGILPEAMTNYLATLGWAPPGEGEIASLGAMVETFSLEAVNSSPAMFDEKKLAAFNAHYIRQLPPAKFVERATPFYDGPLLGRLTAEVQARASRLSEIGPLLAFAEGESVKIADKELGKLMRNDAAATVVRNTAAALASADWTAEAIRAAIEGVCEQMDMTLRKVQAPVRVALTGQSVGLPLFESIEVLGRDRSLARLNAIAEMLSAENTK